jgi:hypothetical protein
MVAMLDYCRQNGIETINECIICLYMFSKLYGQKSSFLTKLLVFDQKIGRSRFWPQIETLGEIKNFLERPKMYTRKGVFPRK